MSSNNDPRMRAIVCDSWGGYRALKSSLAERPALRSGSVRIAVHYATVGFGVSVLVAGKYQRKPPLPFVPGSEVSGVVTAVADDACGLRVGDRVAAIADWGGYAEEVVVTTETVWPVPDSIPLSVACSVPATYGTSWMALHRRGRVAAGDSVLVFGAAGGVGLPAVEIARLAGAHVIAVARTDERLAVALEHGAHEGLRNDTPELGRLLKQRNGGRGIDIVFDPVGGAMFDEALRCAAPEGRILVIGFASGTIPQIPANLLLVKNVQVVGVNFGLYTGWTPLDERKRYAPVLREMMQTLFGQVADGSLRPESSRTYPLENVVDAFEFLLARESVGRVLLKVADD
ncbi:MAG: NADPH:quinone oxidoreductase family protein [Burkholderiaceae bacterium]